MDPASGEHQIDDPCNLCGEDAVALIDNQYWCALHATEVLAERARSKERHAD